MADRRRTVRAVVKIEVHDVKTRTEQRVPLYISGNVSEGGMFLITQDPFERDTQFDISFSLPDDPSPIQATGTVIWRRTDRESPDRPPGMGVQFMQIKPEDKNRIKDFVYEMVAKGEAEVEEETA